MYICVGIHIYQFVQLLSHIQLFVTLWTAAHQASLSITTSLLELAQTHVHWVSDAIQLSHPLSSPSPPTFSLFQHQGLFQWVSSSHQVATVLGFQLQHQSFQWIFKTDFVYDGLVGSPCNPRDSQESSPTPQFRSINHTHYKNTKIPPFFPELSLENLASVLMRRWCIYYEISMDVEVASVDPLCEWAYMLMSPATLKIGSKSIQNHCLEVILKPLFEEG